MRIASTFLILLSLAHTSLANTTIESGPAKVTIPERFAVEKKSMSDEGEVGGFLVDSKTGIRIQFRINDLGEPKGLDPTKVDWKKVLHFERSPEGWFDRQIFVFEDDDALRIEARYMFQRSLLKASIPKGREYQSCIDALKLIDVRLNQGWKLVRGKSFDDFKVIPAASK